MRKRWKDLIAEDEAKQAAAEAKRQHAIKPKAKRRCEAGWRDVDWRFSDARKWRDAYEAVRAQVDDIEVSDVTDMMVKRLATLNILAEKLEAEIASGGSVEIMGYTRLCGTMMRLSERLGIGVPKSGESEERANLSVYLEACASGVISGREAGIEG
jgi:hypothetical protein